MYILDRHMPPDDESMLELIGQFPLGCIVRQVNGELVADHLPLLLSESGDVLRGHVAAANPLSDEPSESSVLVVFGGPESYISPSWCESKKDDGKIVPTRDNEKSVGESWEMTDAPADYLAKLVQSIVGIEIRINRMSGKWKTTLVQPQKNRDSVVAGLESVGAQGMSDEIQDRYSKIKMP